MLPARFHAPGRLIASLVAGLLVAACHEAPTTPTDGTTAITTPVASLTTPGVLTVCKDGPPGTYSFTSSVGSGLPDFNGTFLVSQPFTVEAGSCVDVWQSKEGASSEQLFVTELAQPGSLLQSIDVEGEEWQFILNDVPGAQAGMWIFFTHGARITFHNEFHQTCSGLTPGYWKNWRNHYTAAQFASLLPGTIAGSVAEADAIFASIGEKKSDPITKLRWFVLANQLTLNLLETALPNPSAAELAGDCLDGAGGTSLASALETALAMLANPGNYTDGQILAIKDVLDTIANLGGG